MHCIQNRINTHNIQIHFFLLLVLFKMFIILATLQYAEVDDIFKGTPRQKGVCSKDGYEMSQLNYTRKEFSSMGSL